jgi:hypothetical protein
MKGNIGISLDNVFGGTTTVRRARHGFKLRSGIVDLGRPVNIFSPQYRRGESGFRSDFRGGSAYIIASDT